MPNTVDADTVAAGVDAAKAYANTITIMGITVGDKIPDEDYIGIVTAIVTAVDAYRGGTQI